MEMISKWKNMMWAESERDQILKEQEAASNGNRFLDTSEGENDAANQMLETIFNGFEPPSPGS